MAGLIKRGQIWITNLDPGFGVEIRKKRPALIISANYLNDSFHKAIVIPISTKSYSGLSTVKITAQTSGLDKESVILPAEIRAIDKNRLIKKIGKISPSKVRETEEALKLILGMIELD